MDTFKVPKNHHFARFAIDGRLTLKYILTEYEQFREESSEKKIPNTIQKILQDKLIVTKLIQYLKKIQMYNKI